MSDELQYEVTDDERRYLQRMMAEPGYLVLRKIVGGFVRTLDDQARAVSRKDPLQNKDTIANAWAYLAVAEMFEQNLDNAIAFEIAQLVRPTKNPPTAEEIEDRRKRIIMGDLDVNFQGETNAN